MEGLRSKFFITIGILLLFRLGCALPVPFIQKDVIGAIFGSGNLFSYMSMLSGGALERCALLALGVSPYINASIIMQLLAVALPSVEKMLKEDKDKYRRVMQWLSLGMALVMSIGYYAILRSYGALTYTQGAAAVLAAMVIVAAFAAGAQLTVWLGWLIDDYGIGNGVSLLIFAGIVSRWSSVLYTVNAFIYYFQTKDIIHCIFVGLIPVLAVLAVYFVVKTTDAEKRVPVQYARAAGKAGYPGAGRTHIPIKVVMSGVLPIIFAGTVMSIPSTVGAFLNPSNHPATYRVLTGFTSSNWLYCILYVVLIFAFNFFYIDIQFDATKISNDLRVAGASVPGIRPGLPTAEHLRKTANSVAFLGAGILAIIAAVPIILGNLMGMSIQLGGTSLLIVVGVALEVVASLDSIVAVRHQKGFLK